MAARPVVPMAPGFLPVVSGPPGLRRRDRLPQCGGGRITTIAGGLTTHFGAVVWREGSGRGMVSLAA